MKTKVANQTILLALCLCLLTVGCATSPVVKMPETLPPIVKAYKHVTISPWKKDMVDTGIRLEKGDFFTVLADASSKRGTLWCLRH